MMPVRMTGVRASMLLRTLVSSLDISRMVVVGVSTSLIAVAVVWAPSLFVGTCSSFLLAQRLRKKGTTTFNPGVVRSWSMANRLCVSHRTWWTMTVTPVRRTRLLSCVRSLWRRRLSLQWERLMLQLILIQWERLLGRRRCRRRLRCRDHSVWRSNAK